MIEDTQYIETSTVNCDGNETETKSGHPLIYLNLGKEGKVTCPYCGKAFIQASHDPQNPIMILNDS